VTDRNTKLIQHLSVAHATEMALVQTLRAHIAMTPQGSYRAALETHLKETKDHSARVRDRLRALGQSRGPLAVGLTLVETATGQALALAKGPIDMIRGTSAEEKLLRNARDECATEALEIAVYTEVEGVARALGDSETADLAADIRADEDRMLTQLRKEIPGLAADVVRAEVKGAPVYDPTTTGAADAARASARAGKKTARRAARGAKRTARGARRAPGVTQAEGEVKGAAASEGDLPIAGYDSLSASEIVSRLPQLSQVELGKVDAYERKNDARTTVLSRVNSLRGSEPWAGYDEMSVEDIASRLADEGSDKRDEVREYERRRKARAGVIEASEREPATA
jgi:ferritin-like metal-binding protein YciE